MAPMFHRENGQRVKNVNKNHPFNGIVKIRAQYTRESKHLFV